MNTTSLSFLPQSPDSILTNYEMKLNALKMMKFFIKETTDAVIDFFFKNEIHKFDPHVGETSCQIRAYMILELSNTCEKSKEISVIKNKLSSAECLISKIIADFKNLKNDVKHHDTIHKGQKLNCFFKERDLLFHLSEDVFF